MHSIIPIPVHFENRPGCFDFDQHIEVIVNTTDSSLLCCANYLASILAGIKGSATISTLVSGNPVKGAGIFLHLDDECSMAEEEYSLEVSPAQITIHSRCRAGLMYGIQTLYQLIDPVFRTDGSSGNGVPCVYISDKPRFKWRGMMLDVSRHFFPVPVVKGIIDRLHLYKLNILQLHLNDDQGWRLEIKKYPEFTSKGSWREENGQTYGGFYTQEDIAELIVYAETRCITIIPEIEMPGHCLASLTAHPSLSCTGGPFKPWTGAGICEEVYCAGKEETFQLLCDVIDEVIALFPSRYIHIGGDEVPKKRWSECPDCKKRIADENLSTGEELHIYFMNRMGGYLKDKDKLPIMWDDVLEGGFPSGGKIMFWRDGTQAHIKALQHGMDVIMTPTSHCYFDYKQSKDDQMGQIGVVTLEDAYRFDPCPDALKQFKGQILGGQANIWTETIRTKADVEYMMLPRICAISEALWSSRQMKDWGGFIWRLRNQYRYFEKHSLNARPLDSEVFKIASESRAEAAVMA